MKKTALILAVSLVILICFGACGPAPDKSESAQTTLSFNEKVSYYDSLADAGEVASVEATDPTALYRVRGSRNLVDGEVYTDIIDTFNRMYPDIYYKYGKEYYEPVITLNFDPTYLRDDPANVIGNTINININWFNNNHDKASVIIYYIAATVLDYNSSAPEWLKSSINYYIAAEFSAYGYEFSGKYSGGHYEDGDEVGANFLHWIKTKSQVDITYRANKTLTSATWFESDFWTKETGRTLESLWAEYRSR